jgi:predicted dehydrogenase
MKKICVIGGGRWGQNHIKTLYDMGNLAGIVESNSGRLAELTNRYPVKGFSDLADAIADPFDGFVVATPAETHYEVGKALLGAGKNVLIEKPMTLSAETSKELIEISKRTGARLMVGHVLLFHPAIRKIKEEIDNGKVGDLYYVYSTRLNLGTVRTEENVFWSFAPHDISVLDYLIGKQAIKVEAKGAKFLQDKIFDTTLTQMEYPGNVHAHIFVSWLHPFKEQRLVVIGSKGMLSFDDSSKDKEIHYYDKRIDFVDGFPVKMEKADEVISYEKGMALTEELKYFVEHLDGSIAIAGGQSGYEVVRVLEDVQERLAINAR